MDLKSTYNIIAEDWHVKHRTDEWWIRGMDTFASFLEPGELVLDAGCGGGTQTKFLLARGFRVIGVDFSEGMLAIAKRENPSGEFIVSDLKDVGDLPYAFDGIVAQAVLLHVPRNEAGDHLRRLSGKLKEGGYLYVTVKEKRPDRAEEETKAEENYGYPYERFFSYYTKEEIEAWMREAGCEVVYSRVDSAGRARWIEVAGRKA
jgi:cyclopropane fatty-acyl-phospholipid synthase-like methyltransferase